MNERKDLTLLYALAGTAGVLARDIFEIPMKLLGVIEHFIWNAPADIFLSSTEVHSFWGQTLGILADFTIGAAMGVALGYFLEWRGDKHYLVKGIGLSLIAWLLFFGVLFHSISHISPSAPHNAAQNFVALVSHIIYGVVASWVLVRSKAGAREEL